MILRKIHTEGSLKNSESVTVKSWTTSDHHIRFEFEVQTTAWVTLPALSKTEPAWGLWEADVVEVFLKAENENTYFEFQISPLGQYLELKILRPRQDIDRNYRSGIRYGTKAEKVDGNWTAWMEIPFKSLGWSSKSENWVGGAFACLGPKDQRSYFAAFLPDQKVPDFHLPEYFQPIANLK